MTRTVDPEPGSAVAQTERRDEGDLLLRHLAGDRGAFGELVGAYRAPVYSYLARSGVKEEDREDLFQEVFIRTHRAARTWDSGRPFHPWFFTIVCNVVRNHLRKRRVQRLVFAESREESHPEPADPEADGERQASARQTLRRLEEEIRRLPLKQREVVLLAAVQKRPLKEVAEILGLNLNTVKTHLRRGRLALAQALEGGESPQEVRS